MTTSFLGHVSALSMLFALSAIALVPANANEHTPGRQPVFFENGVPKLSMQARIVGGDVVEPGQVPWQVALIIEDLEYPGTYFLCGGVNIGNGWILTAAHCVNGDERSANSIEVRSGSVFLSDSNATVSKATQVIVHPLYCRGTNDYDIALVKAQAAGTPIALASATPQARTVVRVSGFGTTQENGKTSDRLLFVDVEVKTESACNAETAYNGRVSDKMLCAGARRDSKPADSCQGDSGGPLFMPGPAPSLVGIVSWGEGCARAAKYGVYADTAALHTWITANAK